MKLINAWLSIFLAYYCVYANLHGETFKIFSSGSDGMIEYEKYGEFKNIGTDKYKYVISDRNGLSEAAGTGIFPNNSIYRDPEYKNLLKEKKLEGNHWDYIDTKNTKINFYKWVTAQEDPGTKQYYTALMFERAGMLKEAVKAYYNIVVHFPKTKSYTYWQSPWYMGPNAIDKIEIITRRNPQLGIKLVNADIVVENGFDLDTSNDNFITNPGSFIPVNPKKAKEKKIDLVKLKIKKSLGAKNVKLIHYENGHWQLQVNDKPYIVKAVAYSPNKVGLSPDRGTLNATRDWQKNDFNENGLIDGPYEAWVDKNLNNKQDKNEPTTGDFSLLHEMGCNTIRIYDHVINKELLRDLYSKYGIMAIIGDLLGAYAVGSGATWTEGTDYENPKQQKNMLANIRSLVLENKDEPYTLIWMLGNENVYGVGNNSDKKPEAFFKFVNEVAKLIHELDPDHPVAISNGDLKFLDIIAENCPDVDIFGANVYRGNYGFGRSLFQNVKNLMDKPVIITEYGCSAIGDGYTEDEALQYQAEYFKNNWEDIYFHSAGSGVGNALGGVAFEWVDEWWKANSELPKRVQLQKKEWYDQRRAIYKNLQPETHDAVPQFGAPFIDGWSYEEWFGIFSQGDGSNSPYMRQKRPVYDMFKKIWNE